jgi:hypothetical protein
MKIGLDEISANLENVVRWSGGFCGNLLNHTSALPRADAKSNMLAQTCLPNEVLPEPCD